MNYVEFIKQLIRDAMGGPIAAPAPVNAPQPAQAHVASSQQPAPIAPPAAILIPPITPALVEPDWLKFCRPMTEHFESCYLTAYCDPASTLGRALQERGLWYKYLADRAVVETAGLGKLSGSPWTVGYGATGNAIIEGTVWTQDKADSDLSRRLLVCGLAVDQQVSAELLPYQKAAIVDFTYNEGQGQLARSKMLKYLNARNFADAMTELLEFNLAGGKKLEGLVQRRQAEKTLFTLGSWHP